MVTAKDAKQRYKKSEAMRKAADSAYRRMEAKRLDSLVRSMRGQLKKDILESIDGSCDTYASFTVTHHEYGRLEDVAKKIAIDKITKQLERAPYNYKVTKEESEGYNGEGNNFKDFYTLHRWTISWT